MKLVIFTCSIKCDLKGPRLWAKVVDVPDYRFEATCKRDWMTDWVQKEKASFETMEAETDLDMAIQRSKRNDRSLVKIE